LAVGLVVFVSFRTNEEGYPFETKPAIRFTMEIEKDNTIFFLDTSVSRDSNGLLTTTVYRKPTHTNQYLAYDSHHPQSVKRGIVKCLYDRAKHLTSKPSAISSWCLKETRKLADFVLPHRIAQEPYLII